MSTQRIKLTIKQPQPPEKRRLSDLPVQKVKKLKVTAKLAEDDWVLNKEDLQKMISQFLEYLMGYQNEDGRVLSHPFMVLPSKEDYPDYYVLIKNPMAFENIQSKVDQYESIEHFRRDVLLVFSNCKTYNVPGSEIVIDANELEMAFKEAFQRAKEGGSIVDPNEKLKFLMDAITKGELKRVQKLIPQVADVNQLYPCLLFKDNKFTWAPLHAAAYAGNSRVIELLVEAGGNLEVEDTWYRGRPLAWAAFGSHPKICKLLVDRYKVDKDAKNIEGQTAQDLVPDPTAPMWKNAFTADVKTESPAPSPLTFRIPANVEPKQNQNISLDQKLHQNALALQQRSMNRRAPEQRTRMPSAPAPVVQDSAYFKYTAQPRDLPKESPLLSSLAIVAHDNLFRLVLPFHAQDVKEGYCGHSIHVPAAVKYVNLRLLLNPETLTQKYPQRVSFTCAGFHSSTLPPQPQVGVPVAQLRHEPIQFEASGQTEVQDCTVHLAEQLNSVEFAITCSTVGPNPVEKVQSVVLFITKQ
ncbi:hypothetical protein EDD86DRAFT_206765 [Gorgonomyces haynaldii]|nr:hypothetical protein EDD86DRAFT_206765 [Gorgonomyces haynaldii]